MYPSFWLLSGLLLVASYGKPVHAAAVDVEFAAFSIMLNIAAVVFVGMAALAIHVLIVAIKRWKTGGLAVPSVPPVPPG